MSSAWDKNDDPVDQKLIDYYNTYPAWSKNDWDTEMYLGGKDWWDQAAYLGHIRLKQGKGTEY
jgi:hypothetical protein